LYLCEKYLSVKNYEAHGYTFTEAELQGSNPYFGSDGFSLEGCGVKAFAFNEAKFQYGLDNMTESERNEAVAARERFQRKMDSSGGPVMS